MALPSRLHTDYVAVVVVVVVYAIHNYTHPLTVGLTVKRLQILESPVYYYIECSECMW